LLKAILNKRGLVHCQAWREDFVFFRKLIDPCLLVEGRGMILLDSDCLHFGPPKEVMDWSDNPNETLFIADSRKYSYCADVEILQRDCIGVLPQFFCAGYLCIPRDGLNLMRIESYLTGAHFVDQLEQRRFSHVAEQTIQAMEAAACGYTRLPNTYATCPDVPSESAVAGHFCGGNVERTWFYTKGLPLLSAQIGLSKHN
jgi:hypothetical protein